MIEDCGQLLLNDPWNYVDIDETNDTYPPDPRDFNSSNCKVSSENKYILK